MKEETSKTEEHGPDEVKRLWHDEMLRETEHYYQGEMQHDQRASWLLATSAVLIALVVGSDSIAVTSACVLVSYLLIAALGAFAISALIAVITMLPLRGTRFWRDLTGESYRRARMLDVNQLAEQRFRHDSLLSYDQYEKRIKYHFRSHYLRAISKAYGVVWSSLVLLVGIIFFAVAAILIVA